MPSDAYGVSTPPSSPGSVVYGGSLILPCRSRIALMPSLSWPLCLPIGVFHSSLPVLASLAIAIPALPAEMIASLPLTVLISAWLLRSQSWMSCGVSW